MNRTICHAISDAPSFFLGKGACGAGWPRNLHATQQVLKFPVQACAAALHFGHPLRDLLVLYTAPHSHKGIKNKMRRSLVLRSSSDCDWEA